MDQLAYKFLLLVKNNFIVHRIWISSHLFLGENSFPYCSELKKISPKSLLRLMIGKKIDNK